MKLYGLLACASAYVIETDIHGNIIRDHESPYYGPENKGIKFSESGDRNDGGWISGGTVWFGQKLNGFEMKYGSTRTASLKGSSTGTRDSFDLGGKLILKLGI